MAAAAIRFAALVRVCAEAWLFSRACPRTRRRTLCGPQWDGKIQIACAPTPHHSPMFNGNLLTTPQPQSADCNLSIANHLPVKAGMKTPGACGFLYGSVSRFQFSVGPSGLSATYLRYVDSGTTAAGWASRFPLSRAPAKPPESSGVPKTGCRKCPICVGQNREDRGANSNGTSSPRKLDCHVVSRS